jgi:hypothetical protein
MQWFARNDPNVPPFAVVHPAGFDGTGGGVLTVNVCVDPATTPTDNTLLVAPLTWAIQTWNMLSPMLNNCGGPNTCSVWEDTTFPGGATHAASTLLHELGHCAMGLGHINLTELAVNPFQDSSGVWYSGTCDVDGDNCCAENTSFTNSVNAKDITNSTALPGDFANVHINNCPTAMLAPVQRATPDLLACAVPCPVPANCCPAPPPPTPLHVENIAFFRKADNDPVSIVPGPIDMNTYTSNPAQLPSGHTYARNANRNVATSINPLYDRTQAVMYGLGTNQRIFYGLAADDVNMVRLGMSGTDRIEGNADDYTVQLVLLPNCTGADIRVKFVPSLVGANAQCDATIEQSFDQGSFNNRRHWTMKAHSAAEMLIEVNASVTWDYSILVFQSGFETGDSNEWTTVVP